jgi:serine O-acetyltransferase
MMMNSLLHAITTDIAQIQKNDPAYTRIIDLIFYPGLWAILVYRLSHVLYTHYQLHFIAKLLSFIARMFTGVEIHPAAKIGHSFFIDHGHGVVIGETAVIGHHCTLYHGVTLGGTGKQNGKRHPTLGNHIIVGAGAKVLGNITIGDHTKIGAGSVVVKDVPNDCTVIGVPGRWIHKRDNKELFDTDEDAIAKRIDMPDIDAQAIRALYKRQVALEAEIQRLSVLLTNATPITSTTTATTTSVLEEPSLPSTPTELLNMDNNNTNATKDDLSLMYLLDGAGI